MRLSPTRALHLTGLPALLAVGLAPGARAAQLTPVAQTRSVESMTDETVLEWNSGFPPVDPPDNSILTEYDDSEAAPGFDPFSATATTPQSSASQTSEIGSTRIAATGSMSGVGLMTEPVLEPNPPPFFTAFVRTVEATSSFSVSFDVDETTLFWITGSVSSGAPVLTSGTSSIRLVGPGGTVAEVVATPDPDCSPQPECWTVELALSEAGSLLSGTYTLEASTTGTSSGFCVGGGGGGCGSIGVGGAYDVELQLLSGVPAVGPRGIAALAGLLAAAAVAPLVRQRRADGSRQRGAR